MSKTFISGHRGMVGSALIREAQSHDLEILTASRAELDLTSQSAVFAFLEKHQPETVIIAAAKVGGIHANSTYPADFIYENLAIAANLIEGSRRAGIPRVLFLGSSCIYPKHAPQPIHEDSLLTSPLELSNEAYAIAKIAGLKMCQHYRAQHGLLYHSAMPCNLYGPGDNYHSDGHLKSLLRKCAPKWSPLISTPHASTRFLPPTATTSRFPRNKTEPTSFTACPEWHEMKQCRAGMAFQAVRERVRHDHRKSGILPSSKP
ncbi:MAG: NAD-dependent epimerase/dehydratase family protein [Akkermansiaceae bacterium]|jgi:nucleoside-diphosphate-sugar epimerase|nr:NAD-dependent epimerase/dehydratase family protein [Akkermansiaceae bacterium]MDP4721218.1 NAD-dependent epimerase/dehydratase family protein [Akkermansiaceae bacterium]MDP4778866.1 NAD-dependent epimerase/dehydratase family protein [Akkermansiaceae bacterium]MDP4846933.1 NAD-dependent epimerase/dehydratase family protein [Akkermansiaceae bacterium]MDP4897929.1 NAD-dependent epimerase/dehydratase family protein [Akkermansiaceae bacterium]